jgi:hypothetical protein
MPEHEIAKHTKKIYKAIRDPKHSLKHRIGEVAVEIGIIVFAITLSLFLERWRERQHEREIEKQFLLGLKTDLISDIDQQVGDSSSYVKLLTAWNYFRNAGIQKRTIPADTMQLYKNSLFGSTGLIPNSSRFEALKSSGQLTVIEDTALLNKILDLYQYRMRALLAATDQFTTWKTTQLIPLLLEKVRFQPDGSDNISELFQIPQVQNILFSSQSVPEILARYHLVMQESRDIIKLIEEQYPHEK